MVGLLLLLWALTLSALAYVWPSWRSEQQRTAALTAQAQALQVENIKLREAAVRIELAHHKTREELLACRDAAIVREADVLRHLPPGKAANELLKGGRR